MPSKVSYALAHENSTSVTPQSANRQMKSPGGRLLRFLRRLFITSPEAPRVGQRGGLTWSEDFDGNCRDAVGVSAARKSLELPSSSDDSQTGKSSETSHTLGRSRTLLKQVGSVWTSAKANKKPLWSPRSGPAVSHRSASEKRSNRRKTNKTTTAAAASPATVGPFASVRRHSFQKLQIPVKLTIPMAHYPPLPFPLTPLCPTGEGTQRGSAATFVTNVVTPKVDVTARLQRAVFEAMITSPLTNEVAQPLPQPHLEEAMTHQAPKPSSSIIASLSVAKATIESRIAAIVTQNICCSTQMCVQMKNEPNAKLVAINSATSANLSVSVIGRVAATVRQFNAMSAADERRTSHRSAAHACAIFSCSICSGGTELAFSMVGASSKNNDEPSLSFSELLARFEAFEHQRRVATNPAVSLGRIAAAGSS